MCVEFRVTVAFISVFSASDAVAALIQMLCQGSS